MRIAFGGYEHETNTFSNLPVTAEQLERITLRGGQKLSSLRLAQYPECRSIFEYGLLPIWEHRLDVLESVFSRKMTN